MKKFLMSLCAISTVFFATSCSDFLTEDPKGSLSETTFFASQNDVDMAVTALYSQVCSQTNNTNPYGYTWMGDDLTTHPASNKQAYAQFVKFAVPDDNKCSVATWNSWYKVIKAANFIILNVDKAAENGVATEEVNIAKGQAYYWRGVSYFILVRLFGDIPLNLTNEINVSAEKATVATVYEQIIKDLQAAESILPTSYAKAPRVWGGVACYITKQAALSTLSSVYLTKAGWPLNGGKADYQQAANYAKQVIDGCKSGTYEYALLDDFKKVYSMTYNYNTETIVGINASADFSWAQDSETGISNIFESQGGWGDAWGTYTFWKNFPEGARKDAVFMPKIMITNSSNPHYGKLVDFYEKDAHGNFYIAEAHPAYQVFCCSGGGKADFDYTYGGSSEPKRDVACTSQRRHMIRYSEVLLWYAEASARATGAISDDAVAALNEVVTRAGEAPVTKADFADADAFAERAFQEHGWEVAGWFVGLNTRRHDMQRMNRLKEVFDQRIKDGTVGVEVAPGIVLKEDNYPSGSFSESLIYAPVEYQDGSMNPNL